MPTTYSNTYSDARARRVNEALGRVLDLERDATQGEVESYIADMLEGITQSRERAALEAAVTAPAAMRPS
jgi:hypothetical protein